MDPRADYINYIEDLARRFVPISHDPAGTKRFFLEVDYDKLMGDSKPDNTGAWNLVLMGYETATNDNKHGRRVEVVSFIFDILKHVPRGDAATLNAVYADARALGEEFLAMMEWQQKNPCDAEVSEGITIAYSLRMATKRTMEVGPRYDHFYGYRFLLDLMQEMDFRPEPNMENWRDI